MNTTEHCSGCRNNFYNGNNSLGVTRCWSLEKATLETRYSLGKNVPMNIREAYFKCKKPSCYHSTGYIYLKEIPSYAQTKAQRDKEKEAEEAAQQSAPRLGGAGG